MGLLGGGGLRREWGLGGEGGGGGEGVEGGGLAGGGGVVEGGGPVQAELTGGVAVIPHRGGVGHDEGAVGRLAVLEPEVVQVAHEDALDLRLVLVAGLPGGCAGLGQDAGGGQLA